MAPYQNVAEGSYAIISMSYKLQIISFFLHQVSKQLIFSGIFRGWVCDHALF